MAHSKAFNFSGPKEFSSWIVGLKNKFDEKCIVLLEGKLGSGKTFFVQELVKALGGEAATSPSFAIHNRYASSRGFIDHVDLYRLTDLSDLESTGFWDIFSAPKGLVLVEWGDRLPIEDIPTDWKLFKIKIEDAGGEKRRVTFTFL